MTTDSLIRFENCRILKNGEIIHDDYLVIRNGKVLDYMNVYFDERIEPDVRIDCKGALLSPGLLDIQVNGGFGIDFTHNITNVEEGLNKVAEGLLPYGVTGFCPTLVSSSADVYRKVLPNMGTTTGAINLGVHVEGPFMNKSRVGAHEVGNLRTLEGGLKAVQDMYGELDYFKVITLAPEIDGALSTIQELTKAGKIVSMGGLGRSGTADFKEYQHKLYSTLCILGHSSTNLSTAEEAVRNGASLVTHLFNAMTPFHHRDPGLLGLLTTRRTNDKPIYFGLISDGCHTKPEAVRIAYRTNYEGLVLVTDAISALGLSEGIHQIGNLDIEIKNDCAYILGTETLCGSITPLNKCIKLFDDFCKCGKVKALEAATLHPAQVLGIANQKGTLNPGADADIVFFDDNFEVLSTWIAGCCRYTRNQNTYEIIKY